MKIQIGLVILLVLSLGTLKFYYSKYQNEKKQKEGVQQLFSKKQSEIELYKNKQGQLVAKNEVVELENKTIKALVKEGNLSWLTELQGVKKNMRNLESAYRLRTQVLDSILVKLNDTTRTYITIKGDTIEFKAKDWSYSDKFSSFKSYQITPDSSIFTYNISVPLSGAVYWKRKHPFLWIFSKKVYKSELTSENPNVKIIQMDNIKVSKK